MPLVDVVLQDAGLTLGEIVQGIPHDGPAFVVYALIGAFLYLIWRGNRKRPDSQP